MVYCLNTDVYRISGITSSDVSTADVDQHILEAQAMLDRLFKTTFETKQVTQTIDGNGTNTLFLPESPIVSIDSLTIDGTSVTTNTVHLYSTIGKVMLGSTSEVNNFKDTEPKQVEIQYTYGYNYDFTDMAGTDPDAYFIRKICANRAAVVALVAQIGGTFDDVTSYQLPELSASKGEPFTNIRETIQRLEDDWKRMTQNPTFMALMPIGNWV